MIVPKENFFGHVFIQRGGVKVPEHVLFSVFRAVLAHVPAAAQPDINFKGRAQRRIVGGPHAERAVQTRSNSDTNVRRSSARRVPTPMLKARVRYTGYNGGPLVVCTCVRSRF